MKRDNNGDLVFSSNWNCKACFDRGWIKDMVISTTIDQVEKNGFLHLAKNSFNVYRYCECEAGCQLQQTTLLERMQEKANEES